MAATIAIAAAALSLNEQETEFHQTASKDPLATPDIKGDLAWIAFLAPFVVLLAVGGIWWWRKYQRESSSGSLEKLPRIAPEIPPRKEERELQKLGIDIGGRWGPTLRWWWVKRAMARGELGASDGEAVEAQRGTSAPCEREADSLSQGTTEVGSLGPDSLQRGSKAASSATTRTESETSSRCNSTAKYAPGQQRQTGEGAAGNGHRGTESDDAKPPVLALIGFSAYYAPRTDPPPSPADSAESLESVYESIRDVLWWEGIDFDDEV